MPLEGAHRYHSCADNQQQPRQLNDGHHGRRAHTVLDPKTGNGREEEHDHARNQGFRERNEGVGVPGRASRDRRRADQHHDSNGEPGQLGKAV